MAIELERKVLGRSKYLRAGGRGRILPPRLFAIGNAGRIPPTMRRCIPQLSSWCVESA